MNNELTNWSKMGKSEKSQTHFQLIKLHFPTVCIYTYTFSTYSDT